MEDRPRYNKTVCFDPFPFPAATDAQTDNIRALAEELDAHRKARQAAHPHLTLTGLYNVLEKLRANAPLTDAERDVHEAGQVSVLRDLHDRLDAAVADAYGWPHDLSDEDIVARLVALNAERAAEEAEGLVRWLRPDFQAPQEAARRATQRTLDVAQAEPAGALPAWPKSVPEQFVALRATLAAGPADARAIARRFKGAPRPARIAEMLQTLAALGEARALAENRFAA